MSSKRAGDIMIPLDQYPHIPHWFTLRQAIAEIEHSTLEIDGKKSLPRGLLVFDETYQLLGIVRRRDILKRLEPRFLRNMAEHNQQKWFDTEIDPDLVNVTLGHVAETMRQQGDVEVSEVMQPITATADYDDHLAKVIYLMVKHDSSLLPILKNDNVLGVVRSVDVFSEIANIVL